MIYAKTLPLAAAAVIVTSTFGSTAANSFSHNDDLAARE
jgi:hypothetical protein